MIIPWTNWRSRMNPFVTKQLCGCSNGIQWGPLSLAPEYAKDGESCRGRAGWNQKWRQTDKMRPIAGQNMSPVTLRYFPPASWNILRYTKQVTDSFQQTLPGQKAVNKTKKLLGPKQYHFCEVNSKDTFTFTAHSTLLISLPTETQSRRE